MYFFQFSGTSTIQKNLLQTFKVIVTLSKNNPEKWLDLVPDIIFDTNLLRRRLEMTKFTKAPEFLSLMQLIKEQASSELTFKRIL